jgi:hypothetical protein
MKKSIIIGMLAGAAIVAGEARAETRPGFELGGELFDYTYRERLDGDTVARDDGTFGGIGVGYVETIGSNWFLRARLNLTWGSVDYRSDGAVIDEGEGGETRLDNVSQSIGQLEFHVGKDFALAGGTSVTPFIGLGSRVLEDKSGGEVSEDGLLGYDREISYAYVPIGLASRHPLGGGKALTLSAQYNWVVGGEAKSHFSDLDAEVPDVKLDLNDGHGFEASAMLDLPVGSHAVRFGPFVRHWSLDRSDKLVLTDPEFPGEELQLFEPKNRTTELGIRLAFAF